MIAMREIIARAGVGRIAGKRLLSGSLGSRYSPAYFNCVNKRSTLAQSFSLAHRTSAGFEGRVKEDELVSSCGERFKQPGEREKRGDVPWPSLLMTPFEGIQASILGMHELVGGSFWATIVIYTIGFRLCLVPITVMQMKNMFHLLGGSVGLHLSNLNKIYTREMRKPSTSRGNLSKIYVNGVFTILRKFNVNPLKLVAVPLTQTATLLTFVFATRDLISNGSLDLSNQGILWFTDLSVRDSTLILPLIAVGSSYTALEYSFGRTIQEPGKPMTISISDVFRELFQSLLVFSVPFIAQLPAGVFMYWIPSSVLGIAQTSVLRNINVRKLLGLPIPKPVSLRTNPQQAQPLKPPFAKP